MSLANFNSRPGGEGYGVPGYRVNRGVTGIGGSQALGMSAQGGMPDVDPATINALLQHFGGMTLPDHPAPQGPFENAPWMQNHPSLGHGLDNALIALANMGPTSMSAGDNISNVARGVMSIGPTRNAQAMSQYQVPLMMAGEVAKLQEAQSTMERNKAMAGWYDQRADSTIEKAKIDAESKRYVADQRNAMLMDAHVAARAKEPMIMKVNGVQQVGFPTADPDNPGHIKYVPDDTVDVDEFKRQKASKALAQGPLGNSIEGHLILGQIGAPPNPDNLADPMNAKWATKGQAILKSLRVAPAMIGAGAAADRQVNTQQFASDKSTYDTLKEQHNRSADDDVDARVIDLMKQPQYKGKFGAARAAAKAEVTGRQTQLNQAWNQYNRLPQEQRGNGFQDYLSQSGYDPNTRTFSKRPQTPPQQAPQGQVNIPPPPGGAMGQPQMSPAMQQLQQYMMKQQQTP